MGKWPQPLWAVLLAGMGVGLGVSVLLHPASDASVSHDVLSLASNLVAGALGAFAHAATSTTGNAPGTINQDHK